MFRQAIFGLPREFQVTTGTDDGLTCAVFLVLILGSLTSKRKAFHFRFNLCDFFMKFGLQRVKVQVGLITNIYVHVTKTSFFSIKN